MKAGREHRVPLSERAVEIIAEMKKHRLDGQEFVFAGARGGPLSNMALLMTLRRMGYAALTTHGFRSTFRDWAAERSEFPSEVAEMALAHVVGDKVEAAYRRGDLFEKRRHIMEAWSRFCATSPTYSLRCRVISGPSRWRGKSTRHRGVCFAAGFGLWVGAGGFRGGLPGPSRPVVYGPVGISAAAMWRIKVASGQAAAKARRTREVISTTRAPSFKSRKRIVLNSAVASACALGITSRRVSISQYAAVCRISRIWLASGLRQLVRSEASCALCNLIRFSAWPRAQ